MSKYLCRNIFFRYEHSDKFIASSNLTDELYVPSVITCHWKEIDLKVCILDRKAISS